MTMTEAPEKVLFSYTKLFADGRKTQNRRHQGVKQEDVKHGIFKKIFT